MVEVIQADREAAASVAVLVEMRELIRAGRADHHAEPFAAHRLSAIAEKDAEITRLREVIEAWHDIVRKRGVEIERLKAANGILEDALQEVGDDYPGSSCQEWCRQQVKQARAALKEPSHED